MGDNVKNILFIMRYPLEEAYNLKQKFDGQMRAVVNLGHHVQYVAYDRRNVYLMDVNEGGRKRIGRTHFGAFRKYRSTFGFFDLFWNVRRVIRINHYDVAYMREKPVDAVALSAMKHLHRGGGKLVVEIPSYQSNEIDKSQMRKWIRKALQGWSCRFRRYVDLYTLIGPEGDGRYNGQPAMNIVNGACLDQIPARRPCPQKESIHILALASMRYWQGYDRLIEGVARYSGDIPVVVDMVGDDGDGSLATWKALAEQRKIMGQVVFHGSLYGDALTNMFNVCDIGAGTMGIHRKGSNCGSVLKIREFTARGLPFVYGYTDDVLKGDEPFALQVAADDTPIDVKHVISWARALREQPDTVAMMRIFARLHMSWESQFQAVFERLFETSLP